MENNPSKPRTFIINKNKMTNRLDVQYNIPEELISEEIKKESEQEEILEPLVIKYVILYQNINLEEFVNMTLINLYKNSILEFIDSSDFYDTEIIIIEKSESIKIGIVEIEFSQFTNEVINEFQQRIIDNQNLMEVCKTFDSNKLKENQKYLKELHILEMKIREIFTILTRLQDVNIEDYNIKIIKDYYMRKESVKNQLMNEFYFIEFSNYKNVNARKKPTFNDFLNAISNINSIEELKNLVSRISNPTLELDERFNEATKIPDAIGRLEAFRNNIAHNRYLSSNSIESFIKAKEIIDEVYDKFRLKCINREI